MDLKTAFDINLPKWPQLCFSGKPIDPQLAKNIIFRTDPFLTSLGLHSGGNNRDWEHNARDMMLGRTPDWQEGEKWVIEGAIVNQWGAEIKAVDTEYVKNDWASCCFVGGPHGWCHPDGTLFFSDNVGKWPSVEDVYGDFVSIAAAWPQLEATATLMSGEGGGEDTKPLVTMVISKGIVSFPDVGEGDAWLGLHHAEFGAPDNIEKFMLHLSQGREKEQGLDPAWIIEYAVDSTEFIRRALPVILRGE